MYVEPTKIYIYGEKKIILLKHAFDQFTLTSVDFEQRSRRSSCWNDEFSVIKQYDFTYIPWFGSHLLLICSCQLWLEPKFNCVKMTCNIYMFSTFLKESVKCNAKSETIMESNRKFKVKKMCIFNIFSNSKLFVSWMRKSGFLQKTAGHCWKRLDRCANWVRINIFQKNFKLYVQK